MTFEILLGKLFSSFCFFFPYFIYQVVPNDNSCPELFLFHSVLVPINKLSYISFGVFFITLSLLETIVPNDIEGLGSSRMRWGDGGHLWLIITLGGASFQFNSKHYSDTQQKLSLNLCSSRNPDTQPQ